MQTLLHDESAMRDGDDGPTSAAADADDADDDDADDDGDDDILGYAVRGDWREGGGRGAVSIILADPPASRSKQIKRHAAET